MYLSLGDVADAGVQPDRVVLNPDGVEVVEVGLAAEKLGQQGGVEAFGGEALMKQTSIWVEVCSAETRQASHLRCR